MGKISDDIFQRTSSKFKAEKKSLEESLDNSFINLSNPYKSIPEVVEKVANLKVLWVSQDVLEKQHFQFLCFPGGIQYDRKIDHYRTLKVNPALKLIDSISGNLNKEKADKPKIFLDLSA